MNIVTRLALALSLLLLLPGCALLVSDESSDRADGLTHCSVSCPSSGRASVNCEQDQVPACGCEPTPVAFCKTARPLYF